MSLTLAELEKFWLNPERDFVAYAELLRVARRLRDSRRRTVAFLPSDAPVPVTDVALQLSRALGNVVRGPVGFVDANTRRPQLNGLVLVPPAEGWRGFQAARVDEWLTILTPFGCQGDAGLDLALITHAIRHECSPFRYVVVDLTGFEREGEHFSAIDLADGVVVVAEAGRTHERDVLKANQQLTEGRDLGVLLVG
ncbi:MAG: hypothetical protein MUF34_06850 [Polyangiaceae bacterium]|jgi:hypothetical protein|nr:hypothetical protein [Polyangiaceae bacterium]